MNPRKYFSIVFLASMLFIIDACAKIRLLTFQFNRPDFIETQYRCLNKFLKERDDYELIVVSDAVDPVHKNQIEQTCNKLGIKCVNFPQELHDSGVLVDYLKALDRRLYNWFTIADFGGEGKHPGVRHCQLVRYALEEFGYDHDDIVGIIEGDVFLIRDFSIREALGDCEIACSMQSDRVGKGIEYIWIGLCFINMKQIPTPRDLTFDFTILKGDIFLDSGGTSYQYLQKYPNLKIRKHLRVPILNLPRQDEHLLKNLGYSNDEVFLISKSIGMPIIANPFVSTEFHFDTHFLHQSWSRDSIENDPLSMLFSNFFEKILR